MISIKNIFCLLFSLCAWHATFFASLPMANATLLFRSKSFGIRNKSFERPYHINQPTHNKNVGWQRWRQLGKNIFCPDALPMLKSKGIKGLTEEEVLFLTKEPDKNIDKIVLSQKPTTLTQLGKTALLESDKKMAQRISDAQSKIEED